MAFNASHAVRLATCTAYNVSIALWVLNLVFFLYHAVHTYRRKQDAVHVACVFTVHKAVDIAWSLNKPLEGAMQAVPCGWTIKSALAVPVNLQSCVTGFKRQGLHPSKS